jgi:hypothetical protein
MRAGLESMLAAEDVHGGLGAEASLWIGSVHAYRWDLDVCMHG